MSKFAEVAAQVDKRIAAKRERVLEKLDDPLFDDPEVRPYVIALLTAFLNGDGIREPGKSASPTKLKGVEAIQAAMRGLHFADPNNVTVNVVQAALEANNFKIAMKDEARAVREALYDNHDFQLVTKGEAGTASIYKRL